MSDKGMWMSEFAGPRRARNQHVTIFSAFSGGLRHLAHLKLGERKKIERETSNQNEPRRR